MDTGFAVAKTERWKAAAQYQVSSLAETEVFQIEDSWGSDEANSATLICPWVMVRGGGTGEGMFQ